MTACVACTVASVAVQAVSPAAYYVATSVAVPLLFAHALCTQARPRLLDFAVACAVTWVCIGVCMSVCLHRYFSHRAFRTSRGVQFALGLAACLAFQGDPLWWAVMHRRHHKHCDASGDPHSSALQGVWYAVVGWMADRANYDISAHELASLGAEVCTLEIRMLGVLYPLCPTLAFFTVASVHGWATAVYCLLVPMWLARFITLLFNHEFHRAPHEDSACRAENATRLLAIAVGESQHHDHHRHPRRARRPELDPPYHLVIRSLQKVGLVWACGA
jgi:stearoyl-CoA desaturase (Delta-9 desaturase)